MTVAVICDEVGLEVTAVYEETIGLFSYTDLLGERVEDNTAELLIMGFWFIFYTVIYPLVFSCVV